MLHLIFIETFEYHWDLCKSDVDYKVSLSQNVVAVLFTVEPLIFKVVKKSLLVKKTGSTIRSVGIEEFICHSDFT